MSSVLEQSETKELLRPIETDLLRQTGGVEVNWFGRAATALYRAYQIAKHLRTGDRELEVILPSISCATPANSALLAGVTPRFADVDPATGMLNLASIQQRWTPNTCAVVFIHLFGQTTDLRPMAEWCREKKITLIEDVAQALGARFPDGACVGSTGDLSVYSFNPTKILECSGGALLIRFRELISVSKDVSHAHPLPGEISDPEAKLLGLSYRNLHHSLVPLLRERTIDEVSSSFLKLQPAYRRLYLRRMKNPALLLSDWARLPEILHHRYVNGQQYVQALKNGPWKQINQWRESGVCWRYSLLVDFPEKLVAFSEAVRHDGFHLSNLYWPVSDFFRPTDKCPNADWFARRIVNLWVDHTVDQKWVELCTASLLRNAERLVA
jgi:dTDP-4-amino-4,6-dideoxygalactose transaminase